MELKNKVVSGVAWTATEKLGSVVLQLCVSVIIARLLAPAEFGLIAMLTVFTFISNSVTDSGFSIALLRKKSPTAEDYSSVFYFNVVVSLALYVLLVLLSYPIADFYDEPKLVAFAPVLFAIIPINALGIIQGVILQKKMDFRRLAAQNLTAAVVSGSVSIYLAYTGWGAWALVFQMLAMSIVRVAIMWSRGIWRPMAKFTIAPIRKFWSYSSRMFMTNILNVGFSNVSQMLIGKIYNPLQLGLYYQAQKLRDLPLTSITSSIMSVSFPAFSSLQDDRQKLHDAVHKIIITLAFVIYPLMMGLIAIAPELFEVALTDKWTPAVPYFQILCLTSLTVPISDTYVNVLNIKASGSKVFRLAVVRKLFALVVLCAALFVSVKAVAWAHVVFVTFDTLLYVYFSKKYLGTSVIRQIRSVLPYLLLTATMFLCVISVGWLFPSLAVVWILIIKVVVGAVVYISLAHAFRLEAWRDTSEILLGMLSKKLS